MPPLAGLTGLYGPAVDRPAGGILRDPSNYGGPADPRHQIAGDSAGERPYVGTQYADPVSTDQQTPQGAGTGMVYDHTPSSHAAPWPDGIATLEGYGDQIHGLHGLDLGGPAHVDAAVRVPVDVQVHQALTQSNDSNILAAVPGQLRAGDDDVSQGFGTINGYGLGAGWGQWRQKLDGIPLDKTGTISQDRPFLGKIPVYTHRYDNDSAYGIMGDSTSGMHLADTPSGFPQPYVQPPDPVVLPTGSYDDVSPMIDQGWMAG